jgi:hypothetical protein
MLLDLSECPIDGLGVGDVALHAEKALRGARTSVRDGDLVAVGGKPLGDR